MSRRIEIELTSTRPDGSWTWRAAGAREPKGVLDGVGAAGGLHRRRRAAGRGRGRDRRHDDPVGHLEQGEGRASPNCWRCCRATRPFEAVTQQLAERVARAARATATVPGGGRPRPPRRDSDRPPPRGRPRPPRAVRADRTRQPARDRPRRERREPRPHFEAPPELPQRPKPKRLKPGRAHRNAVRRRPARGAAPGRRARAAGRHSRRAPGRAGAERAPARRRASPRSASGLVQMAEQLLPRLRVAEWLDRADAAKRDLEELDLRDLRSVVTAAEDPLVARDERTRELAAELKQALARQAGARVPAPGSTTSTPPSVSAASSAH